jgi:anti-sigma factor RsiW
VRRLPKSCLDGRSVAAIIYRREQHRINIFLWPVKEAGNTEPRWQFEQGFHMAEWRARGMEYWAISDLNEKDLGTLVKLLQNR